MKTTNKTFEDAMYEAAMWCVAGKGLKALPWLTVAINKATTQEDFDEVDDYVRRAKVITPLRQWEAYHQGRLKVTLATAPRIGGR